MLHLDTITPEMQRIAHSLYGELDESWYLAGGTALALRIGHRSSVDLDYFSPDAFSTEDLKVKLQSVWGAYQWQVTYEAPHTLWCEVEGVKVSFIRRTAPLLEASDTSEPFRLASVADITTMKLLAICSREEYKDYFDMACISRLTDVRSWVQWWETVYPSQDSTSWLVAVAAVDTVEPIPLKVTDTYDTLSVTPTLVQVVKEITEYMEQVK